MIHFLHRSPASGFALRLRRLLPPLPLVLTGLLVTATPHQGLAEAIADPIPAKIQKGTIRIGLEPVASGLISPVLLEPWPGKPNWLLILDQPGTIHLVESGKLRPEPFLDVKGLLTKLQRGYDERGLLGLAFDPGFQDPKSPGFRRFFTYSSEPVKGSADLTLPYEGSHVDHHSVVAAWKVLEGDTAKADPNSRVEIMRIEQPQGNHNGGTIAFGPDGFLYMGIGDGGAANDLGPGHNPEIGNGQDPNVALGKFLRIDVNSTDAPNGKYGIPKDNPFVGGNGVKEIFAMGFRNPYRFSFDGTTLLAGDVGQNKLEYVHKVERGGNYGWRLKEGTFKFNLNGTVSKETGDLPKGLIDPILEYDHDEGTTVIGGYVYHGKAVPELAGKYVFADYRHATSSSGRLFYADLGTGKIEEFPLAGELGFLVKGMGKDEAGELYVLGSKSAGPGGTGGVAMKITAPSPAQ